MAGPSDDLDLLLDSALSDFDKIDFGSSQKNAVGDGGGDREKLSSSASSSVVQGLGSGLPDLRSKRKGKQKSGRDWHVAEALDKLTQQTRDVVKGLESAVPPMKTPDLEKDGLEEFLKHFEEFAGIQLPGTQAGAQGGFSEDDILRSTEMHSFVDTMMQRFLSKEILHEPMKEIEERYQTWLKEHKTKLAQEDYDRYTLQYELIKKLNVVYENDPGNYPQIFELMQKMQECGHPPSDIVQELAPDLNLASLGSSISPETLDPNGECSIM